jgi:hypothetical protein
MGAFEHIIALLSFIYALAITHLLSGMVALIRADKRVKFSWIYAFWLLNAFIAIVANWVSFWDLHALPSWPMTSIVFILLMGIANYMQVALVSPEVPKEGPVDLQAFHAEQGRRYIGAFLVLSVLALLFNLAFGTAPGAAELIAQNAAVIPMIVLSLAAMFIRARWVQTLVPVLLTADWIYYFADLQGALK